MIIYGTEEIEVEFPDGVRKVPAEWVRGREFFTLTPKDIDGWEFRRVLGKSFEWVAMRSRY